MNMKGFHDSEPGAFEREKTGVGGKTSAQFPVGSSSMLTCFHAKGVIISRSSLACSLDAPDQEMRFQV